MEKLRQYDHKNFPEKFSVDSLKQKLPSLRADLLETCPNQYTRSFVASLTESDFLYMYSEWYFRKKTQDPIMQTGFLFEILSQRYVKSIERTSDLGEFVREAIMFLNQSQNNQKMWNAERSSPDDVGILETDDMILISKVYESKISIKAMQRSTSQRAESMITVRFIVNSLNGTDSKVKTRAGWKVLAQAIENLFGHCELPVMMAPDCEYCYILPSDQIYTQSPYEPVKFQTINIPLSTPHIEKLRVLTFGCFAKSFGI